jgi:hypothetical protein
LSRSHASRMLANTLNGWESMATLQLSKVALSGAVAGFLLGIFAPPRPARAEIPTCSCEQSGPGAYKCATDALCELGSFTCTIECG